MMLWHANNNNKVFAFFVTLFAFCTQIYLVYHLKYFKYS